MFSENRNFPNQPLFQQNDLYYNNKKYLNNSNKSSCSPSKKLIALIFGFFFLATLAIVLGLIPFFIQLSKSSDFVPLRQNNTVQNSTILQESDPFSELLSSGNDFNLRSGSIDFDLSLNPNVKLVGVKDTDYEILDLRPTIPNVAIDPETSSKLNALPQATSNEPLNLENEKTLINTDINAQRTNDLQFQSQNLEQPLFMFQDFQEPFNLDAFNMQQQRPITKEPFNMQNSLAPRLNTAKNVIKKTDGETTKSRQTVK